MIKGISRRRKILYEAQEKVEGRRKFFLTQETKESDVEQEEA